MATAGEANRERRIAALEAASRIYTGKGDRYIAHDVVTMADAFYNWLEQKS